MNKIINIPLGLYEKAIPLSCSWAEKFTIAKEAGFDFIEFSIDGLKPRIDRLNQSDEFYRELADLAKDNNMPFQTMALTANRYYPLGDEEYFEKGVAIVKRAIEIASILGIKVIQIAAYDVLAGKESTKDTQEKFLNNLVDLSYLAEEKGIVLAPEVLEDVPFFSTVEKAVKIVNELNRPNIQVYADCGNTSSIGIDNATDLDFDEGLVIVSHIKDATIGNCRNVPFGEGIVDFEAVFKHFNNKGNVKYFVVEVWSDEDLAFIKQLKGISDFVRNKIEIIK